LDPLGKEATDHDENRSILKWIAHICTNLLREQNRDLILYQLIVRMGIETLTSMLVDRISADLGLLMINHLWSSHAGNRWINDGLVESNDCHH